MKMIRLLGVVILSIWIYGCAEKPAEAPVSASASVTEAAPDGGKDGWGSMGKKGWKGWWGSMPMPAVVPTPVPVTVVKAADVQAVVPVVVESATSSTEGTKSTNLYAAKIFATEKIMKYLGPIKFSGELIVWVGLHGHEPKDKQDMVSKSSELPLTDTKAVSAKITPRDFSSAFDVKPRNSTCQKVEPRGTEVPFTITPKTNIDGDYRIGAEVELYGEAGCKGDVVTRTAEPITVTVSVGIPWQELWDAIWTAFVKFFNEFLAISFALLLFLFRTKLKKIFSFEK